MQLWLKLAFRNIWRNPRRTVLTSLVIMIGTACMMFIDGYMVGSETSLIELTTSVFPGHAQIHNVSFEEHEALEKTIPSLDIVRQVLQDTKSVSAFSPRVIVSGMLASSYDVAPLRLFGVQLDKEREVSKIAEALIDGWLELGPHDILLGYKFADTLEVQLNDRVVVTTSQAKTGELAQELFRVKGFLQFNISELDRYIGFVSLEAAQKMVNLGSEVHELALRYHHIENAVTLSEGLAGKLSPLGVKMEHWKALLPQISAMVDTSGYSIAIISVILFSLIILIILNTSFMMIFERFFEFGIIRALGSQRRQVFLLIILECGAIGILGVVLGMGLGSALLYWTYKVGISFGGAEFMGVIFAEPIYPVMRWAQFTVIPFVVLLVTVAGGLYPAWHAAKILPAEALRKSL